WNYWSSLARRPATRDNDFSLILRPSLCVQRVCSQSFSFIFDFVWGCFMNHRLSKAASWCLLSLCLSAALLIGCSGKKGIDPIDGIVDPVEPPYTGPPLFEDVTEKSGIKFVYRNGEDANHLAILESLGGGVGLIDFDGDGLLDIFLPAGGG